MCIECVMSHQLFGNFLRQRRGQPALHVDSSKLIALLSRESFESLAFNVKICPLSIRLGAYRDIFAGCHRHGPGDNPGDACNQDAADWRVRGCDTEHEARGRENPIICSEHRGT
jgi:hypothetical protein